MERVSRRIDDGGCGVKQRVNFGAVKNHFVQLHSIPWKYDRSKYPIQRTLYGNPSNAKKLIEKQIELQHKDETEIQKIIAKDNKDSKGAFTTVGFEHEFGKTTPNEGDEFNNPLNSLIHLELAESTERLAFTNLPFKLETDDNNTIELVGAPFIVATDNNHIIPIPEDVKRIDTLMREALTELVGNELFFIYLESKFREIMGLGFDIKENIEFNYFNMGGGGALNEYIIKKNSIKKEDLNEHVKIMPRSNGENKGITTQVNFATDAKVYDKAKEIPSSISKNAEEYTSSRKSNLESIKTIRKNLGIGDNPNIVIFCNELAKKMSTLDSVKYQLELNKIKQDMSNNPFSCNLRDFNKYSNSYSYVKDMDSAWLKDTLYNFGLGILSDNDWDSVEKICIELREKFVSYEKALTKFIEKIKNKKGNEFENPNVEYGCYDENFFGARQDTYVSLHNSKKSPNFEKTELYLVEIRGNEDIENRFQQLLEKSKQSSTIH